MNGGTVLPPPVTSAGLAGTVNQIAEVATNMLLRNGCAVIELDRPLVDDDLIELGGRLGTLIPERDSSVQPYVYSDVLLNLVTAYGHSADVALQPFATNALSLHTEGSGKPVGEQPRYIVLMCCDPGESGAEAQTVLVPMAAVADRLTADRLALLARTRYRRNDRGPNLVREVDGRVVFSFRDFQADTLEWVCEDGAADPEEVDAAIRALLAAMYRKQAVTGVHWRPGMLVVIDNTWFFHGRTAGADRVPERKRHLKRLRVA